MKKLMIYASILLLVLGMFVVPVQAAPVTFLDGTFNDADWSASVIFGNGPPGSFTAQQVSTGGKPNEYRHLQHSYGGPGNIITAHLRDGALYDPGSQEAILNLVFSFDLILFDGGSSNVVAYGGLIVQDNSFYIGGYELTPLSNDLNRWEGGYNLSLLASDFWLASGTGPANPDFFSSGSPIQFGYFASNGTGLNFPTSTDSGIDNWSASIQPVPVPTTILLFGTGLVGLIGCNWRRQKQAS